MNDQGSTRDRLLGAALTVVREHGVVGATSRQIAAAAGTNLQAITYHFGSKDELVAAALVQAVRSWVAPARELLRDVAQDPAGRLVAAMKELDAVATRVVDQVPAYVEALSQLSRSPELRAQILALLAELRADVAGALRELRAAGVLADWVDPEAMAALVVGAADGVAIHLSLEPGGPEPSRVLGQVVPLLLAAAGLPPTTAD